MSKPSPRSFFVTPTTRSPLAWTLFILMAVGALSLDLLSKHLAFEHEPTKLLDEPIEIDGKWFPLGADEREVELIPGLLHLRAMMNQGAIFGIGQGNVPLFIVVSILAIGFLVFLFSRAQGTRLEPILLGLLLAGVLGNLYDRVTFGYVRDMLFALPDVYWPGSWSIPLLDYPGPDRLVFPYIFNLADSFLVTGVCTLLILQLKPARADTPQAPKPEPGPQP